MPKRDCEPSGVRKNLPRTCKVARIDEGSAEHSGTLKKLQAKEKIPIKFCDLNDDCIWKIASYLQSTGLTMLRLTLSRVDEVYQTKTVNLWNKGYKIHDFMIEQHPLATCSVIYKAIGDSEMPLALEVNQKNLLDVIQYIPKITTLSLNLPSKINCLDAKTLKRFPAVKSLILYATDVELTQMHFLMARLEGGCLNSLQYYSMTLTPLLHLTQLTFLRIFLARDQHEEFRKILKQNENLDTVAIVTKGYQKYQKGGGYLQKAHGYQHGSPGYYQSYGGGYNGGFYVRDREYGDPDSRIWSVLAKSCLKKLLIEKGFENLRIPDSIQLNVETFTIEITTSCPDLSVILSRIGPKLQSLNIYGEVDLIEPKDICNAFCGFKELRHLMLSYRSNGVPSFIRGRVNSSNEENNRLISDWRETAMEIMSRVAAINSISIPLLEGDYAIERDLSSYLKEKRGRIWFNGGEYLNKSAHLSLFINY